MASGTESIHQILGFEAQPCTQTTRQGWCQCKEKGDLNGNETVQSLPPSPWLFQKHLLGAEVKCHTVSTFPGHS